jgi:hypothetical protein
MCLLARFAALERGALPPRIGFPALSLVDPCPIG